MIRGRILAIVVGVLIAELPTSFQVALRNKRRSTISEWKGSNVLQNEYVTWSRVDKHALRANQVLWNDRSRRIAANLGLKQPAHEAKVCVDCHGHNPPAERRGQRFKAPDGIAAIEYSWYNWDYVGFNCYEGKSRGNPVLLDKDFRGALEYAMDRDKIVELAYGGHAWPGYTFMPPDTWSDPDFAWAPHDTMKRGYDPDMANPLNLTSPTTTSFDHEVLKRLEKIADVNARDFTEKLFASGSLLTHKPAPKAITTDCKEYTEDGSRFSVAQIEEIGFDQFWKRKDELLAALEKYRASHTYRFSALLITDVNTQRSLLLLVGDEALLSQVNYPKLEPGIFELKDIVSRKKQLLPFLSHCLDQMRKRSR